LDDDEADFVDDDDDLNADLELWLLLVLAVLTLDCTDALRFLPMCSVAFLWRRSSPLRG
jgi:hypothetical protein